MPIADYVQFRLPLQVWIL